MAPDGSPLVVRDISTQEIHALNGIGPPPESYSWFSTESLVGQHGRPSDSGC